MTRRGTLLAWLAPVSAAAQTARLEVAPLRWRRFAEDVAARLVAFLGSDDAALEPLREAAAAGLDLRLWINSDGRIDRAAASGRPELGDHLAVLRDFSGPTPPIDMIWPMTIRIELELAAGTPARGG